MENQELIPYIRVSRKLFKHWLWEEERQFSRFEAWLDLIRRATFSDQAQQIVKGSVISTNKGQVIASIRFLMKAWGGWSNSKVSDFLEVLRSHQMISIVQVNGASVITLLNYEKHSGFNPERETEKATQKRHGKDGHNGSPPTSYEEPPDAKATPISTEKRHLGDSEATNIMKGKEVNKGKRSLPASIEAERSRSIVLKSMYYDLSESLKGKPAVEVWTAIKNFIQTEKPTSIEPYIDLWNIFGITHRLIKQPQQITDKRVKKFATRIQEREFDFIAILERIKHSKFLQGGGPTGWKVTFEYIIDSEENYIKILEDKY